MLCEGSLVEQAPKSTRLPLVVAAFVLWITLSSVLPLLLFKNHGGKRRFSLPELRPILLFRYLSFLLSCCSSLPFISTGKFRWAQFLQSFQITRSERLPFTFLKTSPCTWVFLTSLLLSSTHNYSLFGTLEVLWFSLQFLSHMLFWTCSNLLFLANCFCFPIAPTWTTTSLFNRLSTGPRLILLVGYTR